MARLPIPQSAVRPEQGRSPRRATAQDFGGDMGLSQLGSALSSLGGALSARQEQQDNYEVERRISEERLGAAVDFDQRMKEAPLGAPGFVEELNTRTEKHREDVLAEYRESGMSEKAVQRLDLKMRALQTSLQSKALTFKAQSYGAKVKSDVEGSVKNNSQLVSMDPSAFESVRAEQREMIEAIPDLDATQKAALLKYSDDQIGIAAGLALAQQDPQYVLASLSGGDEGDYYAKTIGVESSGDPNAKNSRSSATGLGQFTKGTWAGLMRDFPDAGLTPEGRTDEAQSRRALKLLTAQNEAVLKKQGIPINHTTLYSAHFLGSGDAPKALKAAAHVPLEGLIDPKSIKANPFLKGMTAGEFRDWAARKMGASGAAAQTVKQVDNLIYANRGPKKTRTKPVTDRVGYILSNAAASIDPNLKVVVLSGGQDGINDDIGHGKGKGLARIGSTRHDHGHAGDVILSLNGKHLPPGKHPKLYAQYLENAAALGAEGIGHYPWGVHIGGGSVAAWGPNKSKDTLDPVFGAAIARGRKRFASGGQKNGATAYAHAGKTGDAILDSLGASSRQRLISTAQTALNQQSAIYKNELAGRIENQIAAIGAGEAYGGPPITIEDFYAANPLDFSQAEADFKTFQSQVAVSEKINDFKVMSPEDIQAELDGLMPGDTSDPAYAEQLKTHSVASEAARKTLERRAEDPAAYVQQAMPYVAEKFEAIGEAEDEQGKAVAMQTALAAMQDAQAHIGIPENEMSLLPSAFVKDTTDTFNDINLPFEERMGAFVGTILSTADPEQQRQIFEQFVRKDSEFAKFEAAVEAQSRGDTGAARRLFQAGMFDPEKLPGKIQEKDGDINGAIADVVMEEGNIGDAVYGFSANIVGNEETARRDYAIYLDAVRFRMRGGADLEEAVQLVSKDIYGDVEVIEGSFFSGPEIVAAVPKGTDVGAFRSGAKALMSQVKEAAMNSIAAIPDDLAPDLVGPYEQQRRLEEIRVEDAIDNGEWRAMDDGYVFIDTATGTPVSNGGMPLVFSLQEILEAKDAP